MRIRKKRYHPSTIASVSSDGSSTASGFILAAPGVKGLSGVENKLEEYLVLEYLSGVLPTLNLSLLFLQLVDDELPVKSSFSRV